MSGVAGGNRILDQDVDATFDKYVQEVLSKIPGFKKASKSGSAKVKSKKDYGDLDIIAWFEGEDKREVKQRIIQTVLSLPEKVIVPFPEKQEVEGPDGEIKTIGSNYPGKRYYNSGELISVLYPIVGKPGEFIQVDNIIALTEEESTFKEAFLDTPAEKQGLLIGLAKVILTEQDPQVVFERMGISNLPKLEKDEKYEFNLSSVGLTLRQVKKDYRQQVGKAKEPWSSSNWGAVRILFRGFNIDGSFEDLLDDIAKKLQSSDAKSRVVGIFKSMVTAKTGEIGKEKGIAKDAAREKVAQTLSEALDEQSTTVALYAGGFKPPHLAHFANAEFLGSKADKLIIYIGHAIRKGVAITQQQSHAIWEIYAKYLTATLGIPVEVNMSPTNPIGDLYKWVDDNKDKVDKIITGGLPDELSAKFSTFTNKPDLYSNVELLEFPKVERKEDAKFIQADKENKKDDKFSATEIRADKDYLLSGKWTPAVISKEDKQAIIDIVTPVEEPSIEDKMADTIDEVFASFFPKTVKKKQVKEGASGTPIAASSAISSKDRADLENLYQELRRSIDTHRFNLDFQQDRIYITRVMDSQLGWDYTPYQKTMPENVQEKFNYSPYIASILEHMLDQGMNILPLPDIKVREDEEEASDFFGKTAYYRPDSMEVVLYTLRRHPKDVCRSFAHEMIHHIQNLEGRIGGGRIQTSNVNEDEYLKEIEKEAYLKGNILFREWSDNYKIREENKKVMAEGRYNTISNQASSELFRGWKRVYDKAASKLVDLKRRKKIYFEGVYTNEDVDFELQGTLVLTPGTGKMEVLDSTGAGFDPDADFILVNIAIDPKLLPEFWEELSMTLKDILRHEIEHLTHNRGGVSANPSKVMQGDTARRDKIKAGELSPDKYFKLPKEKIANIHGLLFRASKEKRPFADVVNDYLDSQNLTSKEKEEILTLWRKEMRGKIQQPL